MARIEMQISEERNNFNQVDMILFQPLCRQ